MTLSFSESSPNLSPTTAKSNTLYIRLASQRPSLRSSPEKTALSLELTLESASTYSRHVVAGVRRFGVLGRRDVACSEPWLQSDTCSSRRVRKTFDTVSAKTLMMLKFRSRHEVCENGLAWVELLPFGFPGTRKFLQLT